MALPKIDLPIFELKIVSVENPIKFRPFLMKEEKLLLMALQSADDEEIYNTIKQVINNCIIGKIDIDKIPIFDIEYLFLNIRARSIGEKLDTYFICKNIVGQTENSDGEMVDDQCTNLMPISIDVLSIKPPINDLPTKIYLTDKIGIKMNYPTLRNFKPLEELFDSDDSKTIYDAVYQWTDYIFDQAGIYYKKETGKEEFAEFLESLTQEQFDKIIDFFDNLPKIALDVDVVCEKCKFSHTIHMEGLSDFFT